jgi:hypothetical protein
MLRPSRSVLYAGLAVGVIAVTLARTAARNPRFRHWFQRTPAAPAAPANHDREIAETNKTLHALDDSARAKADFANAVTWDRAAGPDPYALKEIATSGFLVGILRGADAVVVLDRSLREIQRLPAPRSPVALAVNGDSVLVAGELATDVARFRWAGGRLEPAGTSAIDGVRAIRGITFGPGNWVYLIEEQRGRLIALELDASSRDRLVFRRRREIAVGNGPIRMARVRDRLIVDCLLDHALVIQRLEASGALADEPPIRIVLDGPIWSFAAAIWSRENDDSDRFLRIAVGAAEDHPLDRTIGAFGYVDSFLYVYGVALAEGRAWRTDTVNLGERGVVLPKALLLNGATVRVSGYGTDKLCEMSLDDSRDARLPRGETVTDLVPGTNDVVERSDGALIFADPLLDAWVEIAKPGDKPTIVPVPAAAPRDPVVRLGEALIFTTLMAPWARSDGPLSRFTCETCHFEGYGDGRIHHTGRGDVHAVTKPLLGLFNNRPHFSRALDPDLVSVAFNEFRVANARTDHDPWFRLHVADAPWLASLGVGDELLSPERLREAFMRFLMAFNHRPNPSTLARSAFTADERAGARAFRDRCESCHEARLSSDVAGSRVPFERWESLVLTHDAPIVWGKDQYNQSGVVPYVHPEGARIPSLRRLYKKHPYFTNGSAKDLPSVLDRARFGDGTFWHETPDGQSDAETTRLDAREQKALLAFLDLL